MSYTRQFMAETLDEAKKMAQDWIKEQDPYRQANIWGQYDKDGWWFVTVRYYGLD